MTLFKVDMHVLYIYGIHTADAQASQKKVYVLMERSPVSFPCLPQELTEDGEGLRTSLGGRAWPVL